MKPSPRNRIGISKIVGMAAVAVIVIVAAVGGTLYLMPGGQSSSSTVRSTPASLSSSTIVTTSATSSPSSSMLTITLGVASISDGYWTLFIAKDAGFFQKYGLDVQLVTVSGGPQVMQGLASGQMQFGGSDPTSVIPAALQGIKVVAIAQPELQRTYYLVTSPSITSPSQLKGKVGGVINIGSGLAYITVYTMLQQLGFDPAKDVTLVAIAGGELARIQAVKAGKIDFTITSSPLEAKKLGLNVIFFLPDRIKGVSADSYVASVDYLANHKDAARRFIQAVSEAAKFLVDNKNQSQAMLSKYLGVNDQAQLDQDYIEETHVLLKVPMVQFSTINSTLAIISTYDKTAAGVNPNQFFDNSVVNQLVQEGFYTKLWGASLTQTMVASGAPR